MRFISDEKELKKISIYTNIEALIDELKKFFYKDNYQTNIKDERIHIAIIDSSEPFSTREVNNSEVIFDVTGGYPMTKQRVYKGRNKESITKAVLWLELLTSIFSVEISADKLDLPGYLERLDKFIKMDIKKYILTEEIIEDLINYEEKPKSKINNKRFIYAVINSHVVFPVKSKEIFINGMEWKYGIKAFQKTCRYIFDEKDETLGYIYEITKEI